MPSTHRPDGEYAALTISIRVARSAARNGNSCVAAWRPIVGARTSGRLEPEVGLHEADRLFDRGIRRMGFP